ncbi:hypothetical protein RNZ50_00620 [Paracoccaceae bacterium Fryx2]|nr:hypothetical protein [Paracoccaceae bacterium Fryx2]
MANCLTNMHDVGVKATCACIHLAAMRGAPPKSPASLAYATMSAALSAAILAEEDLAGSAPSDAEFLGLVAASDAAISSAMSTALAAAAAPIQHPADQALVFSAHLISFGLGIEADTDREAFLHCLIGSHRFWVANTDGEHTQVAIRNAVALLISLSDLIYGTSLGDTSADPDTDGDLEVNSLSMVCAA